MSNDEEDLENHINPPGDKGGHFTGKCRRCGSTDLWDDNHAYGCNACGAIYIT